MGIIQINLNEILQARDTAKYIVKEKFFSKPENISEKEYEKSKKDFYAKVYYQEIKRIVNKRNMEMRQNYTLNNKNN